jgi:general stress protein YciG
MACSSTTTLLISPYPQRRIATDQQRQRSVTQYWHEVDLMSARDNEQTRGRGFASMDQEKQRMIASQGGRAAHEQGTAHEFSSEEARAAGRKGGEAVSANRQHMAAIGRKGGEASHRGSASRRTVQEAHAATPHLASEPNGLGASSSPQQNAVAAPPTIAAQSQRLPEV